MPLRIEGDMMVRFDPRPLNALRVRIDDPRGLLGAAGLLNGDLVTAIDGTEITDAAQAAALRSIAREGEPSRLTVSRRGRTLAVSVDLRAAWDRGPAGGDLRPWVR
jgi:C-terminal processing protease CtpA/Prc